MKKLLILLMCGFTFTQSIQTKELVFSIDQNTTSIDIASEIEMQENELYILTPFFISDFEIDCQFNDTDENAWEIHFRTNNYPMMINQEIDLDYDCESEDDDGQPYCEYYFEARHAVLSLDTSILYSYVSSESCPTFSGNIYFRISGMFEDEGFGLQGDMDNNNILNVVDVIALVNTILD